VTPHCPLHPEATEHCRCCRSVITNRNLYDTVAMALWGCRNGHQEIGPPFLRPPNNTCIRCDGTLEVFAVGVWTSE